MNNKPTTERYSPSATQQARAAAVRDVVDLTAGLLQKSPNRVSLHNTEAVQKVTNAMLARCAAVGILPSVEMLAASLGISRRYVYKFIDDHPDHETTAYIDQMRAAFTAARIAAVDRGAASESLAIFLMLNSGQGFTNEHRLQISQPSNPLEISNENISEASARLLMALPDDSEDE